MDNMNLNSDMLNNLKNIMGEKKVNEALSQISPEMIENFSNMVSNNNTTNTNNSTASSEIDIETIMKIKSIIDKMNSSNNDPRGNLLQSLKPYMRQSRQENIDKYANLLKLADLATLLNSETNEKKENYPNE